MNQNIGLRFDWEEAAAVADLHLIVRARLIEAADTFRHVHLRGLSPSDRGGFWPETVDDYKVVPLRYRPSAAAISRAEEVYHLWIPRPSRMMRAASFLGSMPLVWSAQASGVRSATSAKKRNRTEGRHSAG